MIESFRIVRASLIGTLAAALIAQGRAVPWWQDNFDSYAHASAVPGQGGWTGSGTLPLAWHETGWPTGNVLLIPFHGSLRRTFSGLNQPTTYLFRTRFYNAGLSNAPMGGAIVELTNDDPFFAGIDGVSSFLEISSTSVEWWSSGSFQSPPNASQNISQGWHDLVVVIDLSGASSQTVYVDGKLLVATSWKSDTASLSNIHGINLYGSSEIHAAAVFDDMCLVKTTPRIMKRGYCDSYNPLTPGSGSEPTYRSPRLNTAYPASPWKGFDDPTENKHFGTSWANIPRNCENLLGFLEIKMRPTSGGSSNDVLYVGLPPLGPTFDWGGNIPSLGAGPLYNFNLASMPATTSHPNGANLLPHLNDPTGGLDLLVQDDTEVDCAKLTFWRCCPWWSGVQFMPTGSTSLALDGSGRLVATAATSPGAIFDIGSSGSVGIDLDSDIPFRNLGVTAQTSVRGTLSGNPNALGGTITSVGTGSGRTLSWDYSGLNPAGVRVSHISASGQVLSTTFHSGSSGSVFTVINDPNDLCDRWVWGPNGGMYITYDCNKWYTIGASSVVIEPVDAPEDFGPITSIGVSGTGTGALIMGGITTGKGSRDGDREPLPDADVIPRGPDITLQEFGDGIGVSGLNSSGLNGVRVDLRWTQRWAASLEGVGGEQGAPVNSRLDTYLYGNLDGNANQYVGRLHQTFVTADRYNLASNFDPANAITVRVKQIRNGSQIGGGGVVAANLLGSITGSNSQTKLVHDIADGTIALVFDPPVEHNFESVTRVIDRLEIRPNAIGHTVTRYSQVDLEGLNLGEFTLAEVDATRLVSGVVTLSDFDPDEAGRQVTLQIFAPGDNVPLETHNVTLGAAGAFSLASGIVGPVDITVKGSHWLRKRTSTYISTAGLTGFATSLINGDCDDDNEVGIADYAIVSASYNLCLGDAGYLPAADLNGDDCIDIADYAILSANYGLVGDE